MRSRALTITFGALALSGVLLLGCKRVTKGNTPISGQLPTTTTTAAPTTTTTVAGSASASSTTTMAMAN